MIIQYYISMNIEKFMKRFLNDNLTTKEWYTKKEFIEVINYVYKNIKDAGNYKILFSNRYEIGESFSNLIKRGNDITIGTNIRVLGNRPTTRELFFEEPMFSKTELLNGILSCIHEPVHLRNKNDIKENIYLENTSEIVSKKIVSKEMVVRTASPSVYEYNYHNFVFEIAAISESLFWFENFLSKTVEMQKEDVESVLLKVVNEGVKKSLNSKKFKFPINNNGTYNYESLEKVKLDLKERIIGYEERTILIPEPEFEDIPENDILNIIYKKYPRGKILNMTRKEFEDLILEEFALELRTSNFKNNKEIIEGIKEFHPDIAKQMKLDIEPERKNGKW